MKFFVNVIGILLIIVGIFALGYQGMSYTKKEKIAQIGDVQLTADTHKTIYFPPMVGGLSLVVGVILVLIGRRK